MSNEFTLTDRDFKFLSELVYQRVGIVLADHKKNMVYSRLTRRLRQLNLANFSDYCEYLESGDGIDEMGNLVNAITTNLTSFFREKHHFEHLKTTAIPSVLDGPDSHNKRMRIWSAGCSSGAEPYSIAMTLADVMQRRQGWDCKILATDIDTNMLDRGRKGMYRMQDWDAIPPAYQNTYAKKMERVGEEGVCMSPSVRQYISFKQLNLLESWPMKGPFDIIFCRNVVIYFDKDTQKVLFDRYANLLKPNGWLYIGHSESLFKLTDRFKLIGKTIYQKTG